MRYLVTGAGGMLGTDLLTALAGREVTAPSRSELDITDPERVSAAVRGHDVVINAAAYTRVDDAEEHEDEARLVNALGAAELASAAAKAGARFVQLSTDYVFDGASSAPYSEDAPLSPVSAYGRSKAEGERLVRERHPAPHIVRTAWLYGEHGASFPATMLRLAEHRDTIEVVTDQLGQPTWTVDLAAKILEMLDSEAPAGVYHGTNAGRTSWFQFAREVFRLRGLDPERIRPTDSAAFVRPAPRPACSVLGHDAWRARAGIDPLRSWREALGEAVARGVFPS